MKKNEQRRYRFNHHIANKIGVLVNQSGRYRLTPEQENKYFDIVQNQEQIKRLYLDIETSQFEVKTFRIGYDLRIGYENVIKLPRIICISWNWEKDDVIHNLKWDENQCDKKMLSEFIKVMNEADELVGHNIDRFDLKQIRTRAIFHRLPIRPIYKTFDTLKKSKSAFSFPNNKLDTIAQFLGVGAKVRHDGLKMWNEVEDGDEYYLNEMIKYCDGDIVVLKDVYLEMQNYVKPNTHAGVINGNLKYSCPSCSSENVILLKNVVTAMGTIKRLMECQDCGQVYEVSNSAYKLHLEMKDKFK